MPNTVNYVEQFRSELEQKYAKELTSSDLTSNGVEFLGTKTVKIPKLVLGGYKEHGRGGGWNRQDVENVWETKTLAHDRDVEFFVDAMDVDETNQVLKAANLTATFEEEHAIPETDAYRYSKLLSDFTTAGGTPDTAALTAANVLAKFDAYMEDMDDAGVPEDGRILYVTPAINTMLKNAEKIQRTIESSGKNDGNVQRVVRSLDDVKIVKVPSGRFKSAYDFTDGFTPAIGAKQIRMILVHPRSIIAVNKHNVIYFWAPGTHQQGDGYLYQNRQYWDLFVIEAKLAGIAINVEA